MREAAEKSIAGRVATGTVGAIAQTPLATAPRIIEGTYERLVKQYNFSTDDAGKLRVVLDPEGEKFGSAFGYSLLDNYIEVLTERSGGVFGDLIKKIPGADKAAAVKAAIVSRWFATKPNATVDGLIAAIRKHGGWHGPINEMMEERLGEILRVGTGVDEKYRLKELHEKGGLPEVFKQLSAEYVAFMVPGIGAHIIKRIAGGQPIDDTAPQPPDTTPPADTGPVPVEEILGTPEPAPPSEEAIAAAIVAAPTADQAIQMAAAAVLAPVAAPVEPTVQPPSIVAPQPATGVQPSIPAAAAPIQTATEVAPLPPPAAPAQSFAQPRDRSRPASIAQMNEIASKPDYLRLGPGRAPESGAPLAFANADAANIPSDRLGNTDIAVLSDGRRLSFRYAVVESDAVQPSNMADGSVNKAHDSTEPGVIRALSNGRVAGLRAAHERGTAAPYVEALLADVQAHGVSAQAIQGVQRPMLIRLYSEADNTSDIGALSQGATLGMSGTEQGIGDAKLLSGDLLALHRPADITSPANQEFVRAFVGSVADRSSMLDAHGQLSQAGRRRIEAALMVAAYGDIGLVSELFESTDTDIKAIGDALRETAGLWAAMRDAARDKVIDQQVDTTGNLMAAVALIRKARAENRAIAELAGQGNLLEGRYVDPLTEGWLRIFYRGRNYDRARSKLDVVEGIVTYVEAARATRAEAGLFGEAGRVTPGEVLKHAQEKIDGKDTTATQGGLFTAGGERAGESTGRRGQEGQRPVGEARGEQDAEPVRPAEVAPAEPEKTEPTAADIHALADSKNIPWDNDQEFKKYTKSITGKEHLDDLSPLQLKVLYKKLEKRAAIEKPVTKEGVTPPVSQRERETYEDGRLIPVADDKVFQSVPGPFGTPAVINGTVVKRGGYLFVKITGSASLIGQGPQAGKHFKLNTSWTVEGDPELKRRDDASQAKKAADEQKRTDEQKANAEATRRSFEAAIARGEQPLSAENARVGMEITSHLWTKPGEKWVITEIDDKGRAYGAPADKAGEGGGYLGKDAFARFTVPATAEKRSTAKLSDLPDGWTIEQPPYMEADAKFTVRNDNGDVVARGPTKQATIEKAVGKNDYYYVDGDLGMKSDGSFTREKRHWMPFSSTDANRMQTGNTRPYGATRGGVFVDTETGTRLPEAAAVEQKRETDTDAGERQGVADKKKIEDFGEEIRGARKHYAEEYRNRMRDALGIDVAAAPLSESWPEPDYQKLLDTGADPWATAFVHAARDEIQPKPKRDWKLQGWVDSVRALRGFSNGILDGTYTKERVQEKLGEDQFSRLADSLNSRIDLYQAVGHSQSLKGVRVARGQYSVFDGKPIDPPKIIWTVEKKAAATAFSNWPTTLASGETREAAIAAFKKAIEAGTTDINKPADRQVTFDIYSYRSGAKAGKWYIGKKIGKEYFDIESFDDAKSARKYLAEHRDELVEKLDRFRNIPSERKETNEPRVGVDHRNSTDVAPERFMETFGFRGVQFGNYVEGAKRQQDLNEAYDALLDMAGVLGIPPRALSMNGELGLAFGARGKGAAGVGRGKAPKAHYEPGHVVINLTKDKGAGSLAHEWWHSLDNYFSRARGEKGEYLTETVYQNRAGIRPEMVSAFDEIRKTVNNSGLRQRAKALDRTRTAPYWSTGARCPLGPSRVTSLKSYATKAPATTTWPISSARITGTRRRP